VFDIKCNKYVCGNIVRAAILLLYKQDIIIDMCDCLLCVEISDTKDERKCGATK